MSNESGPTGRPLDGDATGFMGLPRGARDLMPPACRARRRHTTTLVEVFERWGYDQVMTPTVEYFDVLGRGLTATDRRLCVRFIEPRSGEVVALRSDLTPQIARMVAQRLGGELTVDTVHRFAYAADVVRQPAGEREQTEHHQAGVELIGDAAPAADAELLALCHEALIATGLQGFRIDLAHARVADRLVDQLGLDDRDRAEVHGLLARKDRGGLDELLRRRGVDPKQQSAVVALCDLFGPPDVLDRAKASLRGTGAEGGLARLEAVLSSLRAWAPAAYDRITVDLGEVRGFEYYTGLRLRVWSAGVSRPVVRGGRYDDLLGRYGVSRPATGFAVDLDALEGALAAANGAPVEPARTPTCLVAISPSGCDVEAARALAATHAVQARSEGRRAWIQPGVTTARAEALADAAGATMLVYVDIEAGAPIARQWDRGAQGWTVAREGS